MILTTVEEIKKYDKVADSITFISVIICMFSSTRELTREFMQATSLADMNAHDYVYLLPWLQAGPKDVMPWLGADGLLLQKIKDHYENAIIVSEFEIAVVKKAT